MKVKPFYCILPYGKDTYREELYYILMKKMESENYEDIAVCPKGESVNQWIAIHMIFFFNDLNLLYGCVQEYCTNYSCPFMSAGVNFEYLLADKYKYKNPTRVPAKTYIDYLMNWIATCLVDENVFPPNRDSIFPNNYVTKIKNIAKRYFRIYAHIYYSHLDILQKRGIEMMFFNSLTYYLTFTDMYSLVHPIDLRPMSAVVNYLVPNLAITRLLNQSKEEIQALRRRFGEKSFYNDFIQHHHISGVNGLCNDEETQMNVDCNETFSNQEIGANQEMNSVNSVNRVNTINRVNTPNKTSITNATNTTTVNRIRNAEKQNFNKNTRFNSDLHSSSINVINTKQD